MTSRCSGLGCDPSEDECSIERSEEEEEEVGTSKEERDVEHIADMVEEVASPPAPSSASSFQSHLHSILPWNKDPIKWPLACSDYLPTFPHPMDSNFQRRLSAKREFAMLHSISGEVVKEGDLYMQQKFVRLYLSHYDRLFLVSEPGTGKTCSVVSFCEYVVRLRHNDSPNSLARIPNFIILARSTFHVDNIRQMIADVCSGSFYHRQLASGRKGVPKRRRTSRNQSDYTRKDLMKAIAGEGYEVMTYSGFVKQLQQKYLNTNPQKIHAMQSRYRGCLFWVDEAHNIALPSANLINRKKNVKDINYWTIDKFCHSVDGLRIVLSTATPMLNDSGEIVSLVNLLRASNGNPPSNWNWRNTDDATFAFRFPGAVRSGLDKSSPWASVVPHFMGQMNPRDDIKSMPTALMEKHFEGLFMFSRQDPVGVNVEYVGEPGVANPTDPVSSSILQGRKRGKVNLVQSTMSKFHSDLFDRVYNDIDQLNYFFQMSRNVSNFVFPNGDLENGFSHYMTSSPSGIYVAKPIFANLLSDLRNIRKLSCKFHNIVRLCMEKPGNCFIYGEHVMNSGLYVLAACLEAQGMVRYSDTARVIDPVTGDVKEPLASTNVKRFVIFTGDTQTAFPNIMELMNSKHNATGRYIKVFMSSKIGREGITIKNVQHIHLVSPEWTNSGMFQATSRGIRAKAHDALKEATGVTDISVKVYLHCAVSLRNNSIDRNMYFTAERKDNEIQRVMTAIKRTAVNCQIDYDKNVRLGDGTVEVPYTPSDPWAAIGSDESSYKLLMHPIVANCVKLSIINRLHASHAGESPGSSAPMSDSIQASSFSSVLPGTPSVEDEETVQTVRSAMATFEAVYSNETMAYAIQWKLRDKVHCIDQYARPGRMEINRGLVYYSSCMGVNSSNYSDVVMGISSLGYMDLVSKCEDMYYSVVTKGMKQQFMTVNSFVRIVKSQQLSTVGTIYLIEDVILKTALAFGYKSLFKWDDVIKRVKEVEGGSLDPGHSQVMEVIVQHIVSGMSLDSIEEDSDETNFVPIDPKDVKSIKYNLVLKLWYVMDKYRHLMFVFREPVAQLEEMHEKTIKSSSSQSPWEYGRLGMRQSLGRQHSLIRKTWSTLPHRSNMARNPTASMVIVHILHVLDDASSAYSIVPKISKAECRTRVMHLTQLGVKQGWRDVCVKEFTTFNNIVQSIFNIQLQEQSKMGIHGIVYGSTFRVCEPDPSMKLTDLTDRRTRKKGAICSTLGGVKLKSILAQLRIKPSAEVLPMGSKSQRKAKKLPSKRDRHGKGISFPDVILSEAMQSVLRGPLVKNMDARQVAIFKQWLGMEWTTTAVLCAILKDALVKDNRMLYYNIRMS